MKEKLKDASNETKELKILAMASRERGKIMSNKIERISESMIKIIYE